MEIQEKNISQEELQKSKEIINKIWSYYNAKIVGQNGLGLSLLVSRSEERRVGKEC